jgi:hypothetical protein
MDVIYKCSDKIIDKLEIHYSENRKNEVIPKIGDGFVKQQIVNGEIKIVTYRVTSIRSQVNCYECECKIESIED